MMNEGDRIKWTRMFGKGKSRKIKTTSGELIKLVRGGIWAMVILDDKFYQQRVPLNELTLNKE